MKKTWIKIKRGLIEHRDRLGVRIWLYLHMLDIVDWDTGVIEIWKDKDASSTMNIPISTVRKQRRRLEDDGYISVLQTMQYLTITIHNWTNPREYSGKEYNKRVPTNGHHELPPVDTHPYTPMDTPPLYPHFNHILEIWKKYFPNKTQPRPNNKTLQSKTKARMKDEYFRDNWDGALHAASSSLALQAESWFQLEYFLRNEYNWTKCLNGEFSWKDKDYAQVDKGSQERYGN